MGPHQFRRDVGLSVLKLSESQCDLLSLVELFNLELTDVLDKHAPVRFCVVTICVCPAVPWYNTEIVSRFVKSWKENGVKASNWAIILSSKIVLSTTYYTQHGPCIILIL